MNQAESEKAELNQEKANLVNVFNLKKKFINLNLFWLKNQLLSSKKDLEETIDTLKEANAKNKQENETLNEKLIASEDTNRRILSQMVNSIFERLFND